MMQNWRLSYDPIKPKLSNNSSKTMNFPTFLSKSAQQKNQYDANTDSTISFKKQISNTRSPFRPSQLSKSPKRSINQTISPLKSPKILLPRKNMLELPQQVSQSPHKSSIITQDSQDSICEVKQVVSKQRFVTNFRQQKISPIKTKNNKKQNIKTDFSPFRPKNISNIKISKPVLHQKISPQKSFQNFIKNDKTNIADFQFLSELGRGYYSVVYLARHRILGMYFAIKIIFKQALKLQKSDSLRQNIFRELKIHSFVKNPNLISLYKIINDAKYVYLIMEYATGGTLYSLTKKQKHLSQQKTCKILKDVCRGLKYLHDNDIMHRDIKLQNIMLTQGIAKIGDFGCAVYSICMRKSNIGSPAYLSPQQLNHNFYGKKIDIWSLGVLTYQMLFETTPFDKQIIHALKSGELSYDMKVKFPTDIQVSDEAKDFISKCLQKKQNSRMSIDQVLSHPFLNLPAQKILPNNLRP